MKYFQCIVDNQDGSFSTHRFKSYDDALAWLSAEGHDEEYVEFDDYPYGPLEEVDTDSKYYWAWPNPWAQNE
jgi:hypothetical protein